MPKPLMPSLRERNRYVAFELSSDGALARGDVVKALWSSLLRFVGESGASRSSLWVMEWDEEKKRGIAKVNHQSVDEVRAAFALIKEINGKPVAYRTLGVSGTVKKTREKHLGA